MQIAGVHALITGGASGLGLATARGLHERGAHVFLADLPSSDGVSVSTEIGDRATFVPTDVTDTEQVRAAVAAASSTNNLRVVVNCAGVATPGKLVGRDGALPFDTFMRVVAINLGGTMNVCAQASAVMAEQAPIDGERGVIVNTASAAAFEGQIGQIAYSASKGGVASMTLPMARELAKSLIRAVTISPGLFETPMMAGMPEAALESLVASTLHPHRLGTPGEYADLAAHIVENPMLNGATIRLDGAVRLAPR